MKIFKDIMTGDELFTDTYNIKLVDDVIYEVQGNLISRNHDNIVLTGANPSAEAEEEGNDESVEYGVDIVLNHRLQECFGFTDKKFLTSYLKGYMKKLLLLLQESSPDQADVFKNNANKAMQNILGRFKELQFFVGESMDVEGMVAMCEYREIDGKSVPVFMFLKHGLIEEKV